MNRLTPLPAATLLLCILGALPAIPAEPPAEEPTFRIADLAWLAGRWTGEGFGGKVEETWSPPTAGTMTGTFRLDSQAEGRWTPTFYEFMVILETPDGIVLRLKHFNPDVTGWETQDEFVDFPLIRVDKRRAEFRGLIYERTADGGLRIEIKLRGDEGVQEVTFRLEEAELR